MTYSAALEQAEQQFHAAARVATESRAINLFYGLAQAGRAVACAYADAGESYQARRHGIANKNLEQVSAQRFPKVTVQADHGPDSSFRRLSELLGSASLDVPVEIGALWAMLVEPNTRDERLTHDAVPSLMVTASRTQPDRPCIVSIPLELVADGLDLDTLAQLYPALRQAAGWRECGNGATPAGIKEVHYELTFPNGIRGLATYRGESIIFPAVPGTGSEMQPMMIWWAILYSLSMLTRYRPETWTKLVNVDSSEYAVPVEFILEIGLDAVPDVIAHVLDDAPTA
jgi:YaaC-like Protein